MGMNYYSEFHLNHPLVTSILRIGVPVFLILILVYWKWVFPAANISIPPARTWLIILVVVLVSVAILGAFDWLVLNLTK